MFNSVLCVLVIGARRESLSSGVALVGEQSRSEALSFRDPLDLEGDCVDSLIQLRELGRDLVGYLRRTTATIHSSRERAREREADDDYGDGNEEAECHVHRLRRNVVAVGAERGRNTNDGP